MSRRPFVLSASLIAGQERPHQPVRSRASLLSGVQAISIKAGSSHTCAAEPSGAVKCWGYNRSGGLGDGTTTDRPEPVRLRALTQGDETDSRGVG